MDFGKLQHIDNIDFTLPSDDPITAQLWQRLKAKPITPLRIYVGGTEWGALVGLGLCIRKVVSQETFWHFTASSSTP
jgi:hypothetical protein